MENQAELLLSLEHVFDVRDDKGSMLARGSLQLLKVPFALEQEKSPGPVTIPVLSAQDGQFQLALTPELNCSRPTPTSFEFSPSDSATITISTQDFDANLLPLEDLLAYYTKFQSSRYQETFALVDKHSGALFGVVDGSSEFLRYPQFPDPSASKSDVVILNDKPVVGHAPLLPESKDKRAKSPIIRTSADMLLKGSVFLSKQMLSASTAVGGGIAKGSEYLKGHMKPAEKDVAVNSTMRKGVQALHGYTQGVRKVTGTCVGLAIRTAETVGKHIGAVASFSMDKCDKSGDTRYLLESGVVAFYSIFESFDESIKIIAVEGGKATVELVEHKFGKEAASLVDETNGIFSDLVLVYFDSKGIARRALVKATVKSALNYKLKET